MPGLFGAVVCQPTQLLDAATLDRKLTQPSLGLLITVIRSWRSTVRSDAFRCNSAEKETVTVGAREPVATGGWSNLLAR